MWLKRAGIILFIMLLFVSPAKANSVTVSDISRELICQCGCNMVLENCSHAECASREAMTADIKQRLAEGQSKEEIIQLFVDQYGEQVLSVPPKKGFNLTAWIAPLAAFLFGGMVVYIALKGWIRRSTIRQAGAVASLEEGDEHYQRRLDKELEEFTGRGFR